MSSSSSSAIFAARERASAWNIADFAATCANHDFSRCSLSGGDASAVLTSS